MKGYDDMWCLGEVCQFDTDTGPWSFNDGHWVQDTESNCAEVAWMQIPDKASDVSLGHWGQVAKSSGAKVPGAGSPDEALDVSLEHWGVAVPSPDETPEVSLEHCVEVAGADTTDEAPDDEHWGGQHGSSNSS